MKDLTKLKFAVVLLGMTILFLVFKLSGSEVNVDEQYTQEEEIVSIDTNTQVELLNIFESQSYRNIVKLEAEAQVRKAKADRDSMRANDIEEGRKLERESIEAEIELATKQAKVISNIKFPTIIVSGGPSFNDITRSYIHQKEKNKSLVEKFYDFIEKVRLYNKKQNK
jgi:hypothetical protein